MILPVFLLILLPQFHSPFCEAHRSLRKDGIRAVDLCNFSYPSIKTEEEVGPEGSIQLRNGVQLPDEDGSGLIELEEIQYADVTHDGRPEAVVTMFWHSGGTMQLGMVYVVGMKGRDPVVLWDFIGGDRGFGGLHRAYGKDGDLWIEVLDPDAAQGNCCSSRILRTRYRWNGATFVQQGKGESLPNPDYKEYKEPQ